MKNFQNKHVLITGGARGIGKQIGVEFAKKGANIIICDLDKQFFNPEEFKSNVKDVENLGVQCFGYQLDVINVEEVKVTRKKF